ncbi:hypothetical protein C8R46DRAFT_1058991 [Mycena filopes]|nr:hypothetical protein C8R46DRAFT_1058991 [Mycena filopes]
MSKGYVFNAHDGLPHIEDALKDTVKWNSDYERLTAYFSPLMFFERYLAHQGKETMQMRDMRNAIYPGLVSQTVGQQRALLQDIFGCRALCFDEKWQRADTAARRKHVLIALAAICSAAHNLHETRRYCPELNLAYLTEDPKRFLDLLKSVIPEDISSSQNVVMHFFHEDWDAVAKRQRSHPEDIPRALYEECLILRTKLIGLVLQATFRSFLGMPVPTIKLSKGHGEKQRFGTAANVKKVIPPGAIMTRPGCSLKTCPNGMHQADIPKSQKFLRCKPCWAMFAREIQYCDLQCQKADWKSNHKAICGKPLDFETVARIAAPAAQAPSRFFRVVGPAKDGFTRSTALTYVISQLCLRPESDYLITTLNPYTETVVDFVNAEVKARFCEFREKALTTGDREAIAVVAHAVCWWASLGRYGGPVTGDIVVEQFRMEFSFPSVKAAIMEMEERQIRDQYQRPPFLFKMDPSSWMKFCKLHNVTQNRIKFTDAESALAKAQ